VEERYVDVVIIGSGTAGLNAMGQVRRAGKSFVLINGGEPGTTCARVGCMPSKALIQVADDFHTASRSQRHGVAGGEAPPLDAPAALEHVRHIRDTLVDRVLANSTDGMSEEVFIQDYARLLEPTLIAVGDQRIRAGAVVIATGSRPLVPDAWRAFGDRILTSDEIFEQEDLPGAVAVIGLGVIGLELGQSLRRLGVTVTGFDQLDTIGGISDPEVLAQAREILGKAFPLHLGQPATIAEVEDGRLRVSAGDAGVVVDKVLCCIGRTPNVEGLGLECLGLPLDRRGLPPFDNRTMRVGDLPVYIAGDVDGERPILHEAGDEGKIAGYNAARQGHTAFRRKTPLAIIFSDPNIIAVGARYGDLDPATTAIGQVRMAPVGRALVMGQTQGLLRIYADRPSGRLLGAEMIGPKGENLAHGICWSIELGLTVGQMLRLPFYHPVMEEALQAALYDAYRQVDAKNPGGLLELEELAD
jgi:dihydrolipoamide dehydrogenase